MKKIRSRYEIKSKIGEGGMGVVFRAYDPPPMDRDVAIKTLPPLADRFALDLFYKECNILKSISHPNIVEIFDMGEFDEGDSRKPFFVMPLLQGQTLDEIIKKEPHRLTVSRVVDIIAQTCRGLQAAHDQGLTHRDIKPSNIFIIGDDSVKIIDFGVARAIDSLTRSGSFTKGTLLYMSPEQVTNQPVTPQSDIFSLALVCYEALTRRHPFRGTTEEEIVEAIRRFNPPPASAINDAVSQLISRVVHKGLAKQPLTRYSGAKEFGDYLQRALHNLPIEIFDPARIQPRIDRAKKAMDTGDFRFAGEIVTDLESGGHLDPQISELRADIEKFERQRTIAQLLENAQTRFEEEEDPLALQKIHEILQIDPGNMKALGLKAKIEERRSERQVDQWMSLARQHIDNHSYAHARDALQNVLVIRPKESRALRLAKELEAEEQEYQRLREEKSRLYESAVNAWKNGDVSEALSHMRAVLDLDRRAPDGSLPERSASYQSFYNKVHSEHEALNNGYAEARRCLAQEDFAKALEICQEFLTKYPGQPLFQALKFDVEERRRQRQSSYIADVNRSLEAEPDLDAKVSLLREAAASYPDEVHFERLLKLIEEKRDLVRSIVLRAESHESRGQFNEALSDFETLESIYPSYPGLRYEIERLQKRREQQGRDAAKAEWVRKVDRQRESGNHSRALELLDGAEGEFPNDSEFVELRRMTELNLARVRRAEGLTREGQRIYAEGDVDGGLKLLREALEADDQNSSVRTALRDTLIDRARAHIPADWQAAEALIDEALRLDPQHPAVRSLRSQVLDGRRDDTIAQCAAQARRLQADNQLETAEAELKRVLATYPSDPRLTTILETVQKELGQTGRRKARLSDLEQLRELQRRANDAGADSELQTIFEQTRQVAGRYSHESSHSEIDSIAREIERIVQARGGRHDGGAASPAPTPANANAAVPNPDVRRGKRPARRWRPVLPANRLVRAGIAVVALVAVGAGAITFTRLYGGRAPDTGSAFARATVHVRTSPPGGNITIDNHEQGVSDVQLALDPGEHQLAATLLGYAPLTRTVTLDPGSSTEIELTLEPLATALRLEALEVKSGGLWLNDIETRIEGGRLTQSIASPGSHVLRIANPLPKQEVRIAFTTAIATLPAVISMDAPELQVVAVTSLGSTARITSSVVNNAAVTIDGQPHGTLTAEGVLVSGLTPGRHELTIGAGSEMRRLVFEAGHGPSLDAALYPHRGAANVPVVSESVPSGEGSPPTVDKLPNRAATLEVTTEGQLEVTIAKDGEIVQRFTGGAKITIPQGSYSLVARDTAGVGVSDTITVGPGESKTVALRTVVAGMERFERTNAWSKLDGWYSRRGGGFVLYDVARPLGRIAFTLRPRQSRILMMRNTPRVRWVVGFANGANYVLVEMDGRYLYRSEIIGGKKTDLPRVEHQIPWDSEYINLAIEVTENRLTHHFSLAKDPWKAFDVWDRAPAGGRTGTRAFVDGKFGFYLPGSDEIDISNFSFYSLSSSTVPAGSR
jgi:serine/threonine-protein kinase